MMEIEKNTLLKVKNGVLIFPDETLFLRQKDRGQFQFDYLLGKKTIHKASIENFKGNVLCNTAYCSTNGIPYLHVIFPCKAIAYREEFKEYGLNVKKIANEDILSTGSVYYPEFNRIEKNWFMENDTHCSHKGYKEIMHDVFTSLNITIPNIGFTTTKDQVQGDLGKMLGNPPIEREIIKEYNIKSDIYSFTNRKSLPGNTGQMHLKINTLAPLKKRIALFGDSFFVGCLSYLSHIFEEVFYIRNPFILQDVANSLKPDIILTGNAERYLVNTPSASKVTPYFMNYVNQRTEMRKMGERNIKAFNCFFCDKTSSQYNEWKSNLSVKRMILNNKIDELRKISLSPESVDAIRDHALSIEKRHLPLAYKLMQIALNARPNGHYIAKKTEEYSTKMNNLQNFN
jgi:hypothetical protein